MRRGRTEVGPPSLTLVPGRDQLMAEPTDENFESALLPRKVMAMMHTTAMRATRRAYSTSEAPRSVLQRAWSQALTKSKEVSIPGFSLWWCIWKAHGRGPDRYLHERYRRRPRHPLWVVRPNLSRGGRSPCGPPGARPGCGRARRASGRSTPGGS